MVESRNMEDMNDGYMYGDEGFGFIQDADLLDRQELFLGNQGWLNFVEKNMLRNTNNINTFLPMNCTPIDV